jgi:hypothetical protein
LTFIDISYKVERKTKFLCVIVGRDFGSFSEPKKEPKKRKEPKKSQEEPKKSQILAPVWLFLFFLALFLAPKKSQNPALCN